MAWDSGRMGPEGRGGGGEREGCQGLGPRGHGRDERRQPGVNGPWAILQTEPGARNESHPVQSHPDCGRLLGLCSEGTNGPCCIVCGAEEPGSSP